jgi:hypothetical protein
MLLFCCLKNSQDATVLSDLKAVQDIEKNHPTKTKYRDLFLSDRVITLFFVFFLNKLLNSSYLRRSHNSIVCSSFCILRMTNPPIMQMNIEYTFSKMPWTYITITQYTIFFGDFI